MERSRRSLLGFGAAAAAAGLVLPRPAAALRIEDLDAPRQRMILQACETRTAHARVVAEMIAEIEGRGVAHEEALKLAAQGSCPFCGCSLAAAAAELPAGDDQAPPRF